jgi:hypothetical protein
MPKGPRKLIPEWLIFDECDRSFLASKNWHIDSGGYATSNFKIGGKWLPVRLHRILTNAQGREQVDHINGNRLDNRRANLRIVAHFVNCHNTEARPWSKTGVKNVWFYPETSRRRAHYMVQIRCNGKRLNLGRYKTLSEAALVAAEWRRKNMPGIDMRSTA